MINCSCPVSVPNSFYTRGGEKGDFSNPLTSDEVSGFRVIFLTFLVLTNISPDKVSTQPGLGEGLYAQVATVR